MEKRLIDATRARHPRASASLLHRMQNRWYRYALARTGSTRRAIEVVQDSALSMLADRANVPPAGSFDAWAMDFAVRSAAQPDGPTNLVKEARASGMPLPIGHVEDDDKQVLVRLQTLPTPALVCLLLRIGERMPQKAVVQITGFPETDVSRHVRQAIETLRAIPVDQWPVDPQAWYLKTVYPSDLREELFQKRRPRWIARIGIFLLAVSVVLLVIGHYGRKPPYLPPPTASSTATSQ